MEWTTIASQTSSSTYATMTMAGDIIQSRSGSKNHIAKITSNGKQLWEKCIFDCTFNIVILSTELEDKTLLHLLGNGDYYLTNANGGNPTLVGETHCGLRMAQRIDNQIIAMGAKYINNELNNISVLINLENLEFESTLEVSEYGFQQLYQNAETGNRVELYSDSGRYKFKFYNSTTGITTEKALEHVGEVYFGIALANDDNIILVGFKKHLDNGRLGLVRSLDHEGNEIWVNVDEPQDGITFSTTLAINIVGDDLYTGGYTGMYFNTDAHLTLLDKRDGTLLWELTEHLMGKGDLIRDIIIGMDGDIILSGTTGVTDYGGPNRAFVMKVSTPTFTNSSFDIVDNNRMFYPNPTYGRLHYNSSKEIESIEILDMFGRKLSHHTTKGDLDISKYSPGNYVILAHTKNETIVEKIIKY